MIKLRKFSYKILFSFVLFIENRLELQFLKPDYFFNCWSQRLINLKKTEKLNGVIWKTKYFLRNNKISLKEMQTRSTEALKDYCQRRPCNISGTTLELCARICYLYNNSVPEEPSLKEEISKKLTSSHC